MTLPTAFQFLPGWLPPWAQLALLVAAVAFALALLMLPFAVFGLKGRLDLLEAQLDDIHSDLRSLATRLAEAEPERPRSRVVIDPHDRGAGARAPARPAASNTQDRSEPHVRWPPGTDRDQ